ncbi:hypothetical protein [Dietzia sp. 179-F 9C3 NHS]|uniref:hypothetical protein n=1 Tax=Dietzia sp. 179-F 9C3 NHS TaxID=3374295 RepID=UPI0038798922
MDYVTFDPDQLTEDENAVLEDAASQLVERRHPGAPEVLDSALGLTWAASILDILRDSRSWECSLTEDTDEIVDAVFISDAEGVARWGSGMTLQVRAEGGHVTRTVGSLREILLASEWVEGLAPEWIEVAHGVEHLLNETIGELHQRFSNHAVTNPALG